MPNLSLINAFSQARDALGYHLPEVSKYLPALPSALQYHSNVPKLNPEQLKQRIINEMVAQTDFATASKKVMLTLKEQMPEEARKFEHFLYKHRAHLKQIRKLGWAELKKQEKTRMQTHLIHGLSFESFRTAFVKEVIEFNHAFLRHQGYQDTGRNEDFGTVGYDSDIDTTFYAPPGMPEEDQILKKYLFDMVCYCALGGFSGEKIDVEEYLVHPGITYDAGNPNYFFTVNGREGFSRIEANMYFLQMKKTFEGNPDGWEAFKELQKEKAFSPEYRATLVHIFADVEIFEGFAELEIKKLMAKQNGHTEPLSDDELEKVCQEIQTRDPSAKEKATMSYKLSRLIVLSKQMDTDKRRLSNLEATIQQNQLEISRLAPAAAFKGAPANIRAFQKLGEERRKELQAEVKDLEFKADRLKLRIITRASLRQLFFPEGYNSHGALLVTVERKNGQREQRNRAQALKEFELYKSLYRNADLFQIFKQNEESALQRNSKPGFHYTEGQKIGASIQENISSMNENLSMYMRHFNEKVKASSEKEAVVACSKYSERLMKMAVVLLEKIIATKAQVKTKPGLLVRIKMIVYPIFFRRPYMDKETAALHALQVQLNKLKQIYFITSELEKNKRKQILNYTISKELLLQRFRENGKMNDQNAAEVEKAVDHVLQMGEPTGMFAQTSLPEDRLLVMVTHLEHHGLVSIRDVPIQNLQKKWADKFKFTRKSQEPHDLFTQWIHDRVIYQILKARSGFPIVREFNGNPVADVQEERCTYAKDQARGITLNRFNLTSTEQILEFNKQLMEITTNTTNLCLQNGVGYLPSRERDQDFSLIHLWQQARIKIKT